MPPPLNRNDHREGNDDYTQAGNLFRLMSAEQKKHPINNIVGAIKTVPRGIQERQIAHFTKADPAYGQGVARVWVCRRAETHSSMPIERGVGKPCPALLGGWRR